MSDLAPTVVRALRERAGGRRLKLCVLCRGNLSLAEAVLAEGHRSVVVGDRFKTLFALQQRLEDIGQRPIAIVEAELGALPVARFSLDALVLSRGLPAGGSAVETLTRLRQLLAPGGLLIWPHPTVEGTRGKLGRVLIPVRSGIAAPAHRHELTAWTMEAGFRCVGQLAAEGSPAPWVVTTGTAGRLKW